MAIVNVDWKVLNAEDLYVILASYGAVKSVRIYLSDYGRERLEYEQAHGPGDIWLDKNSESAKLTAVDDGADAELRAQGFDPKKLRAYERQKLKYYFAIAECKTKEDAEAIYNNLDAVHLESGSVLDIRFVPEDVKFTFHTDECISMPNNYTPPQERPSGGHSKVWNVLECSL